MTNKLIMRGITAWMALMLILCVGPTARSADFYDSSGLDLVVVHGTLLRYEPLTLPPFYRAKAWRILYATRDYADRPVTSSGTVILSNYAPAARNRRIVAWAHPTSGINRRCAPSMRSSPIESISGINELISGGYIIAATDYPGLGTSGTFGFLIGKGQGQAAIDSVRAARQIPGVGGSSLYALWGYSQGGHSALFAAGMSTTYAPELSLVGVATAAPPTNLNKLLNKDINSVDGRIFAALTLLSWSKAYDVPMNSLVDDDVTRTVTELNDICIDDLDGKLKMLAAQEPLAKKFLNYNPNTRQPWKGLLQQNSVIGISGRTAAFISQGADDELVRPSVTREFIGRLCRTGISVSYDLVEGADHEKIARLSAATAIAWIGDRFEGKSPLNSCESMKP